MERKKLSLQHLEPRHLLAGDIGGPGSLNIVGTQGDDTILVEQVPGTRNLNVTRDNGTILYEDVELLRVIGQGGADTITVNTLDDPKWLIPTFIDGGDGDDVIQGGGGDDVLIGGSGDDIISNFITDENYNPIGTGSKDVLIGGDGDDSLWGGWGLRDVLLGNAGNDVIYDIVGGSNTADGGDGKDFIVVRGGVGLPTDPLNNPGRLISDRNTDDDRDTLVAYDAGTQAGGPVRIGDTLYVLNLDGGDTYVSRDGADVVVELDGLEYRFASRGIKAIAGLGGATGDLFQNDTDIASVYYGQGGDDVLLGGTGFDLLKGGNGNDVIDGRDGSNDISGDAGFDVLLGQNRLEDVVRVDALDSVFADLDRDRLVVKTNLSFS